MDKLCQAMDGLKVHKDLASDLKCLDSVLQIFDDEDTDQDTTARSLLEQGILGELSRLIRTLSVTDKPKVAQVVAELAKTEETREPCVVEGLVAPLLEMLASQHVPSCTQAARALGNICFDNDNARDVLAENNGIHTLIKQMKHFLDFSEDGASRLRTVLCGMLLNITNTHETVQEKALSLGAMEVLQSYLINQSGDENVVQMALMCVGSLAESDPGKENLSECNIVETIAHLLGTPVGNHLQETIIELLTNLSESDDVKVQLAESDLGDRLLDLVDKTKDAPEDEQVVIEKLVSDLLVLILTGDKSMEILYGNGTSRVYHESLNWMDSSSEQLKISGALAIGNFARNDCQCMKLVESHITEKLLDLLEREPPETAVDVPTLKHAVLSALRNLAIPASNKPRMLEYRLIERLLPSIYTEFASVQYKLLGTLRMVIDGQEKAARQLGTHDEFLKKLVSWCTAEDHAGVKGEANRLVAWLVKHSRNSEVMTCISCHGGIPHLVNMSMSEHAVMQNEALVALTLMASTVLASIDENLAAADVVPTIKVLLTADDTLSEIMCNVLTLVKALTKSVKLLSLMKIAELGIVCQGLAAHSNSIISKPAKELCGLLKAG